MGTQLQGIEHQKQSQQGKDLETRTRLRLGNAHRNIPATYDFKPNCFLHAQQHYYFNPTAEDHLHAENDAKNLENWIQANEPMIKRNAKLRKDILDSFLCTIDE
ncbi:hypothetical protein IV203_029080 [Nitzschia inconspicua]|uniref:Uncharacterized protein n=1 Tax=Nitzschia inconspicua TaxID=303405 RepID=A0A9K3LPX4_9STRA|nr:hypothetical protein IV203_029080 [Nitzschia inconspicua]